MAPAEIAVGMIDSPLGELTGAISAAGLVRLAFPGYASEALREELAVRLGASVLERQRHLDPLRGELELYFEGRLRRRFRTKLDWSLVGPFARRVLEATAEIPYGGYLSYGEVAGEAGSPRGARAAGNALACNPFALVVPCHRILAGGGGIGGYGGGLERKRFLLELEGTFAPGASRAHD